MYTSSSAVDGGGRLRRSSGNAQDGRTQLESHFNYLFPIKGLLRIPWPLIALGMVSLANLMLVKILLCEQ